MHRTGRTLASTLRSSTRALFAMLAVGALGCVVVARRPARWEVAYPPPPPATEAPVLCDPGYARVPGHWRWNGYQYVWVPQRCIYRPGYRYEAGGYYPCGDGYCFREGTWIQASGGVVVSP